MVFNLILILLLWIGPASAQIIPSSPEPRAIEACEGKEERASCYVGTPNGIKHGVCVQTEDKQHIVCIPYELKINIPAVKK